MTFLGCHAFADSWQTRKQCKIIAKACEICKAACFRGDVRYQMVLQLIREIMAPKTCSLFVNQTAKLNYGWGSQGNRPAASRPSPRILPSLLRPPNVSDANLNLPPSP